MENSWSLFSSSSSSPSGTRGHCSTPAWDIWDLGTPRVDWSTTITTNHPSLHGLHASTITSSASTPPPEGTTATTTYSEESTALHALMLNHHHQQQQQQEQGTAASLYAGADGTHYLPDPHLMCLKLGKRHYFEDATVLGEPHVDDGISIAKRGRSPYYGYGGVSGGIHVGPPTSVAASVTVASTAVVPRCQVEGCHVALVEAKDYHRRHKVCEMHAKAPKVVVLGLDQRFCQQCSRFHAVTEFDEAKRSCRRRLAGHNERRRKGSAHDSINPRYTSQGRALSLLSSKNNTWFSSADLSSRCSAALRELIAENRAAILARQLIPDHSTQPGSNPLLTSHHQMQHDPHNWDRFNVGDEHVTLDLMQAPSSAFGFLSVRGNSRGEDAEEECSELWRSFCGAHII